MKLKDKVAIVTGSGRSIGKEVTKLFSIEGAKVVVVDLNDEEGISVRNKIEKNGGDAIFVHADVTRVEEVKNLIYETIKSYKKIDILVNNVGNGVLAKLTDQTEDEWMQTIDITLNSAFLCSKYALKEMLKNEDGGIIVNISSIDGLVGEYGYPSYNAGKAGMINLTRSIALDYATSNIRANTICPGPLEQEEGGQSKEKESLYKDPKLVISKMIEAIPMGKRCKPIHVAKASLFLASDDSEYITGTTLVIDGGLTAYSGLPKFSQLLK